MPQKIEKAFFIILLVSFYGHFTPVTFAAPVDDNFIAGYVTAVLEREFNLGSCSLDVENGTVNLSGCMIPENIKPEIIEILSGISGVDKVVFGRQQEKQKHLKADSGYKGVLKKGTGFFPKGELFAPILADPRWPHFFASYWNCSDNREFDNVGSVGFGETFSLYRDNFPMGGFWEIGIDAGVFSVFDLDADSNDLINSDFWVAFPSMRYRHKKFSALARLFHQSSHLGDEYLLRSAIDRVNLSYEGLTLKLSYEVNPVLRLYAGGGYLIHKDPSDLKPFSLQFGLELYSHKTFLNNMVRPLLGIDIESREESDWNPDLSVRMGFQFERPKIFGIKYQLMFEYYNGYSPQGQFYSDKLEYYGIGTHLYF